MSKKSGGSTKSRAELGHQRFNITFGLEVRENIAGHPFLRKAEINDVDKICQQACNIPEIKEKSAKTSVQPVFPKGQRQSHQNDKRAVQQKQSG